VLRIFDYLVFIKQKEIVVAKQQPEMRGGLNYIRKIYEKEKHYGER
jgi:hypothetical protein